MGIRFHCPNGHKLNVKAFQAGQMGICPVCGVKTQIPLKSTRPSSGEKRRNAPAAAHVPSQAKSPAGPSPAVAAAAGRSGGPSNQSLAEPPRAAAAPAAGDPLAEAATWYVRPATGGQFGPATSEIMRIWLAEGRIAADTLVWREGWRDWQEAERVFRQVPSGGGVDSPVADHSAPIGAVESFVVSDLRHHVELQPKVRRMPMTVFVVGVLVLLGIVAVVLFIWGHR
jgi:hypothetical protein